MKLTKEQFLGIVRHTITFVGGVLIAKGYISDSLLNEIAGVSTALAGVIWSVIAKTKA